MLLRFRVANVLSLRDEQELSFVVPSNLESGAGRTVKLSDGKQIEVYPLVGIFGANASGKSNVLTALMHLRTAVLDSYAQWTSHQGVPREEFALDAKASAESSFYEADFVLDDGVRWTYGFELGPDRVEAEWLHSYPRGRRQEWLDRDASREKEFHFPGERIQDRARLARTTRPNALLLSHAATDNHPQLSPIYRWFHDNLWPVFPEGDREDRERFTIQQLQGPHRERIEELLRVADLGITGTRVDRRADGSTVVGLVHAGREVTTLDWQRESFGTRSWFALLGPMLLALDTGAVLLVDELDASLHPRFAAEVVRLFHDRHANPRGAQLVFTSHDPSLLATPSGGRLLDPGQVWLTEKDEHGATELYPLTAAEPGEAENLTTSYLAGAFGAVPGVIEGQIGRRLVAVRETEAELT
ncbi:ATP-binding protein [Streptomyces sp. A3M-1-3]|uniref:AAA family ATPase n=1 Tax=Streptomyces sp. A3M-1-3 TaxID=2962044 RepID=UPI0020B71CB3|nr:ATP-binding protein [Streptomyces sp. A3M-1-3]MCP3819974.1 ATP-binding protein [Streptomyces sp. A3M-1-3]